MARPRRFDWLFRPQLADEDMPLSAEARFAEALADLPAVERSALALSEIGGLDANEIALRLGTDPVVVRKLLVRARESVRTTLALRSRRGLIALIPFQSWWQTGSGAPAVRAAGAVAVAVIGTGVAIGGASADPPRNVLTNPDPPAVRTLTATPDRQLPSGTPVVATAAVVAPQPGLASRSASASAPGRAPAPQAQALPHPQPAASSPSPPQTYGDEPAVGAPPPPVVAQAPVAPSPAVAAPAAPVAVPAPALPPVALPPVALEPPPVPVLELPAPTVALP